MRNASRSRRSRWVVAALVQSMPRRAKVSGALNGTTFLITSRSPDSVSGLRTGLAAIRRICELSFDASPSGDGPGRCSCTDQAALCVATVRLRRTSPYEYLSKMLARRTYLTYGPPCAVKSPSFDPLLQKLPLKERPSPEKLLTCISPSDLAPEQFTSWYGTVCGEVPAVTTA